LLVTARDDLRCALLDRLPAGAASIDLATGPREARARWRSASAVLVGPDQIQPLLRARTPARDDVLVLLEDGFPAATWASALRLGVERAVDLDEAGLWLSSLVEPLPASRAILVAVTGARGGCGASSLAVALGIAASRSGRRTVLVDLDPHGGGLDVPLGLESSPGDRWPDLTDTSDLGGDAPALDLDSLPRLQPPGGAPLVVVAADREPGGAWDDEAAAIMLGIAAEQAEVVVADLPRHSAGAALPPDMTVLLVVPGDVRGAAAGRLRLAALPADADVRLVVRDTAGHLDVPAVEAALGRPVAGQLPDIPRLADETERGRPPGFRPRSRLATLAAALLDGLTEDARTGAGNRSA
jgi:secretion/DNA translocation related CpaE-like protein